MAARRRASAQTPPLGWGVMPGGGIPGFPNGFLEDEGDVIDLDVTFRVITWETLAGAVAACAVDPVCAVSAVAVAGVGAGYLIYKGIQAGVQIYQAKAQSKAGDQDQSRNLQCEAQYQNDLDTCRGLGNSGASPPLTTGLRF